MTLQSVVRRKPNAFNLLRQLRILQSNGCDTAHFEKARLLVASGLHMSSATWQVWEDASQFQQALSIGKQEAGAAYNLLQEIDPDVTSKLSSLVMPLGCSFVRLKVLVAKDC